MDRVVNEVQVMHRLNSPHTLRFHNWYETRNNLWLILEYCTGGDMLSLLNQDGRLPEAAVKVLYNIYKHVPIHAPISFLHFAFIMFSMNISHCLCVLFLFVCFFPFNI